MAAGPSLKFACR